VTGRFVLSLRAQAELDGIWDYTADRWGIDQAEAYTRQLWEHIAAVAARLAIGRECPEVRPEYHKFSSRLAFPVLPPHR
jgi:toxin ParE1/3/4